MGFSLEGKRVLVTGSSDGLGRLLANELASKGALVTVHGRSEEKVDSVLKELEGEGHSSLVCDYERPSEVIDRLKKINDLDILVNNVGMWQEGSTVEVSPEVIPKLVNSNLTGALLTTRVLLPILLNSEFSQIVNVSSIAGVEIPSGYYHTIYSAVKWGVQAFSESLAKEFDGKNLRVMGYYPGGMETEFFKKVGMDYDKHEPWMFDPIESVESIMFMLTRNPKVSVKRMDLINHLQQ